MSQSGDLQCNTSPSLLCVAACELISSHQHLCHNKKPPQPVGLLSLRHLKTKSQAWAQKHTWHLQALTHSYDPPALTETQRTRLQMAEAQSCVSVSHFFTSKSQKLPETKNCFKETARNQWAKQPDVDGVLVQVCTCERLMHRDDDTKIHTSLFTHSACAQEYGRCAVEGMKCKRKRMFNGNVKFWPELSL